MPAVSVILPIYNAQPYLAACLESVCGQTLHDIQIICVNDGSTDNSLDTIQAFAARDERQRIEGDVALFRGKRVHAVREKEGRGFGVWGWKFSDRGGERGEIGSAVVSDAIERGEEFGA